MRSPLWLLIGLPIEDHLELKITWCKGAPSQKDLLAIAANRVMLARIGHTGAFGIVCLISLTFPRPIMF